jgi:sulfide dehydrogenase cytochrome subunit
MIHERVRKLRMVGILAFGSIAATAWMPAAAQSAAQPPLIAQGCIGCHGQAGAGRGSIPKIAGYGRDIFIAQWAAFKTNQRPATIMNRVAPGYTDAEVAVLADYFSKLK